MALSLSLPGRAARLGRRAAIGGVLASMLTAVAASTVSAAPPPLTIQVLVGDFCVQGTARPNATIKVVIRDADGSVKGRDASLVDEDGRWSACADFFADILQPGDSIKAKVFETGQARTFKIPRFTIDVNRVTDVVSGRAPANSKLMLYAIDQSFAFFGMESYSVTQPVTANDSGNYSYDFGNQDVDLLGGAQVAAIWMAQGGNVEVARFMSVPYVLLQLNKSPFSGAAKPAAHVAITLTNGPDTVAEGHAVAEYGADFGLPSGFSGRFFDSDGEPYRVMGGEHLSAPALGSDASWTVPAINGSVELSSDRVSGHCIPNELFIVIVQGDEAFGADFGTTAGDGHFSVDMTGSAGNIRSGDQVEIVCLSSGRDQVIQDFVAK
jgi:hypothetical protein